MGIGDKLGDMADKAMDKLGGADKVKDHIDKAADVANGATGDKFEEHIDKAEVAGKSVVDKLSKDDE